MMVRRFGQFVSVFLFLSSPLLVLAQATPAPSAQSCFDYYKFQSVEIDLHGEKNIYKAGEGAKFLGSITNKNSYPLVGGSLVLRISKLDPRSQLGNDIIDEWTAKENINLIAGEKQLISLPYQLASGLPTGTYTLTSYFLTQNKFNISGLSFTDDIYGGYAIFSVEGKSEKTIKFDRTGVKADSKPYRIFGLTPKIFPEDAKSISVSVPLKNETAKTLITSVTYSLYAWDGADKENLIKSWSETQNLAANSSKTLSFDAAVADRPVYFLKIKAQASDQQSEIHIRFVKNGFRPRLNYVGVTKFPLTSGEKATLFACYHNTTEIEPLPRADFRGQPRPQPSDLEPSRDGTLELSLKNMQGRVLADTVYKGPITGAIEVLTKAISSRNLDKFVLSAKLYDDKNNLVDESNISYDCSKFSGDLCLKRSFNVYFFVAGFILIIIALYFIKKHFKKEETQI